MAANVLPLLATVCGSNASSETQEELCKKTFPFDGGLASVGRIRPPLLMTNAVSHNESAAATFMYQKTHYFVLELTASNGNDLDEDPKKVLSTPVVLFL